MSLVLHYYSDNKKVLKYYFFILNNEKMTTAYVDDHDLFLLLEKYVNIAKTHGIQCQSGTKITSNKSSTTSLDLPNQLHQHMDRNAKESRTLPQSPHIPMPIPRTHLSNTDGEITSNEKFILETNWSTYHI